MTEPLRPSEHTCGRCRETWQYPSAPKPDSPEGRSFRDNLCPLCRAVTGVKT